MPRMSDPTATRAKKRATLLEQKAAILAELAQLDAAQRTADRQDRLTKQAQVGKLADDAGLLAYDLERLEQAFVWLAETLAHGHGSERDPTAQTTSDQDAAAGVLAATTTLKEEDHAQP